MKILKHGDPNRLKTTKKFLCTKCGCEFEADAGEYELLIDDHYDSYFCPCPECKGMALVNKEKK